MNYRTYADMALHIKQILPKISDVDLIVGIPRSGMVPAYMIGAFLNCYVCSLDEFVSGIAYSKGIRSVRERTVKKVLVVDDSVNDGLAMRRAKERLQGKEKEFELVYMAVYAVEKATGLVDVYADICPQPRFFQWNYMYHPGLLPQACLDIDGVLCVDPTAEENDDGEKYRQFILNARPLFVPNDKVKALELLGVERYDLVLLDLNLPGRDGMTVLRTLRQTDRETRVLILSARSEVEDKVEGLDAGANDYLAKPFHLAELEARVRSLTLRQFTQPDVLLTCGGLTFDTRARVAFVNGQALTLTRKETGILEYLMVHRGRPVSQEELMDHVWDNSVDNFSNSIRVHISALRKKLRAALGYDPIRNRIGEGYLMGGTEE